MLTNQNRRVIFLFKQEQKLIEPIVSLLRGVYTACEQARLFGVSCEYLGGGAAICETASLFSAPFSSPASPARKSRLRHQDTRAKTQTSELACKLRLSALVTPYMFSRSLHRFLYTIFPRLAPVVFDFPPDTYDFPRLSPVTYDFPALTGSTRSQFFFSRVAPVVCSEADSTMRPDENRDSKK